MKRVLDRVARPDRRDRRHMHKPGAPQALYKVWPPGPILDQKKTSGCVGYGISGWSACSPIRNTIKPDGIYKYARYIDEWKGETDDGTSVRAGMQTISSESDFGFGLVGEYRWGWTIDELVATIINDGPVVLGLPWMTGMMKTDSKGFIRDTGFIEGGHCVFANGVSINQGWIKIANSWGTRWGVGGFCKISFEDMAKLLVIDGEFVIAKKLKV
jgi:hypothetical protein